MSSPPAGPVSVAFCPCPPLLLPQVAGRAATDTAALRAACADAVEAVLAARPEVVVLVAPDAEGRYGPGDGGDLRGFGVDVEMPLSGGTRPGGRRTPLGLTVGAWLLDAAGHAGPRIGTGPRDLAAVLAGRTGPVAVLAMGDGSARRSVKAPGHLDDAAAPFDAAVAAALAAGDAAALAALDAAEGERLLAAGVPVWQAVGALLAGREVDARLLADEAPFGVGYLVAAWTAR
ncbi:hypothetical protein SAMN04488107_2673 [Geodermatophilus saharensis]|uniref:Catalytic LigB subunit of aromatic ring-opening dioxygenase n=1 Tax=Geodermatophilus saharensis TaxID=1137994 RepID=A0A239ERC8_9ACTN|nr:hypothetical protein [Geodermatophilus saharensis]SNS46414.1 hypothetical protein SAMN04488107_2673 [Geodermatophilus saharensis]